VNAATDYIARIVAEDSRPDPADASAQIDRYLAARRRWLTLRADLPMARETSVPNLPTAAGRATVGVSSEGATEAVAHIRDGGGVR
jgi:hypothetical protein